MLNELGFEDGRIEGMREAIGVLEDYIRGSEKRLAKLKKKKERRIYVNE